MSDEPIAVPPVVPGPVLSYQHGNLPRVPAGWTHPRFYALRAETLPQAIRLTLTVQVLLTLPPVGVVIATAFWLQEDSLAVALITLAIVLGIMSVLFAFKLWRIARRVRKQWPSFRLLIADQGVLRTCQGYPDLQIEFPEITRIRESGRLLSIRGKTTRQTILLRPQFIEGYGEIRAALAGVRPIETIAHPGLRLAGRVALIVLLVTAVFGTMGLGLYSRQLAVELACAGGLMIYAGWSLWVAWRSPNVQMTQKIAMLVVLMFPFMVVVKTVAVHVLHIP